MENLTITQWLEKLPEPLRTQALNNTEFYPYPGAQNKPVETLAHALSGFIWRHTPEGLNYWCDVQIRAERGDFDNE